MPGSDTDRLCLEWYPRPHDDVSGAANGGGTLRGHEGGIPACELGHRDSQQPLHCRWWRTPRSTASASPPSSTPPSAPRAPRPTRTTVRLRRTRTRACAACRDRPEPPVRQGSLHLGPQRLYLFKSRRSTRQQPTAGGCRGPPAAPRATALQSRPASPLKRSTHIEAHSPRKGSTQAWEHSHLIGKGNPSPPPLEERAEMRDVTRISRMRQWSGRVSPV
jgi:hypothetical protein